jgi:hypothetical protein
VSARENRNAGKPKVKPLPPLGSEKKVRYASSRLLAWYYHLLVRMGPPGLMLEQSTKSVKHYLVLPYPIV